MSESDFPGNESWYSSMRTLVGSANFSKSYPYTKKPVKDSYQPPVVLEGVNGGTLEMKVERPVVLPSKQDPTDSRTTYESR